MDPAQWFFIAGCQRSGTTMLRLVLECHSQITCLDEMRSYRLLAGLEQPELGPARRIGLKIPRFSEQLDADMPVDYGLAERPGRFYHGQPVLFMVRDFRDAIDSMLKLKGNKSWLEDWAWPILRDKAKRDPAFADRWRHELRLCGGSASLPAVGALYWAYKNESLLRYRALQYPVLPISYEAFVTHPRAELLAICAWLQLPFEEGLLAHPQMPHGELTPDGLTIGNTDPKRSIDTESLGHWSDWLKPHEVELATSIAGPVAQAVASSFQGPTSPLRSARRRGEAGGRPPG